MHSKALIIGARPEPAEGPWVPLLEEGWIFQPFAELVGKVQLNLRMADGTLFQQKVDSLAPVILGGTAVQVVILERLDMPHVSMNINFVMH